MADVASVGVKLTGDSKNIREAFKQALQGGKKWQKESEANIAKVTKAYEALDRTTQGTLSRVVQAQIKVGTTAKKQFGELKSEVLDARSAFDSLAQAARNFHAQQKRAASTRGVHVPGHRLLGPAKSLAKRESTAVGFPRADTIQARAPAPPPLSKWKKFKEYATVGWGKLKGVLEWFGITMPTIQGIVTTAFRYMGLGLKVMVAKAATFQEEFAVVRAITTGSAGDFENLRFAVQDVANATEHASNKVLKATTILGRAGFQAEEIGEALKVVADLATAGGLDISAAAELSVRMLRSFGMELKDLRRISNMLATASASANVTIRSLAEGFKFTGAIAETVGLEFSDVTTALSLLGETGLEAGLAGRALQAMIMDLSKPSNAAKITLARMGITTHDVSGKMLKLSTILRQLKDANMTAADSFTIFNRNSARAVTALVRNIDKYKDFETTVKDGTTALKEQSDTIRDSFNKQVKALSNNIDTIAENIGRDLLPQLESWVKLFRELTGWFVKRQQSAEKLQDLHEEARGTTTRFVGAAQGVENLIGARTAETLKAPHPLGTARIPTAQELGLETPETKASKEELDEAKRLRAAARKAARELQEAISVETNVASAVKLFTEKLRFTMIEGSEAVQKLDVAKTLRMIFQDLFKGLLKREGVAEVPKKIKELLQNILKAFEDSLGEPEVEKVLAHQKMVQAIESWRKRQIKALEMNARVFEKVVRKLDKQLSGLSPEALAAVKPQMMRGMGYESADLFNRVSDRIGGPPKGWDTNTGDPDWVKTRDVGPEGELAAAQAAIDRGKAFDRARDAEEAVWDGLIDASLNMAGSVGGFASDMIAASAGGPWAMAAAAVMNLMASAEGFKAVMVPLEKLFVQMVRVIEPFMEPLYDIVDAVLQIVEGIMIFLMPVVRVIASWTQMLIDFILGIINTIIEALNWLLPEKWEIDKIGEDRDSFSKTMADLDDETKKTTDNFADLNATLIESANVASGFKTNLRAFQAALIDSTDIVLGVMGSRGGPSGPRPIGFHAGGVVPGVGNTDSVPAMLTPGETVIPRGGAVGGIVIHNMHVHVADTKDFMRKLTREREWQTLVRTGSPIKGKLYGAR